MDNGYAINPLLATEPTLLDFGAYHPQLPLSRQPTLTLNITNLGVGTLKGRLIPQVSWIILPKFEFTCESGETSIHTVQISTGAPQAVIREHYQVEQLILIDSNAGTKTIHGSYHIGFARRNQKLRGGFPIYGLLFAILVVALFLITGNLSQIKDVNRSSNTTDNHIIFTSGAETVLARLTETAAVVWMDKTTESVNRVDLHNLTNTAADPLSSNNSSNSTLTPWPRELFPSPEEAVSKYYREINAGQYEIAWSMLTTHFQQTCCAIGGNDPFIIYSDWWSHNIEKVEVNSAYLQAWDVNPAPVLVSISYYYKNGKIEDLVFLHYLIADAERGTLLIDEVH